MVYVLSLIIVVILISIVRPNIANVNLKKTLVVVVVFIVLIDVSAFSPEKKVEAVLAGLNSISLAASRTTNGAENTASVAVPKPVSKWRYSEDQDVMRRTATKYAQLESKNSVDLDFPYGVVHGRIVVRKRPADESNVMFVVDKAETLCDSYVGNFISVKFDDGPIKRYNCNGGSVVSSEMSIIENASDFLDNLKRTKRTIIEAEFYQKGNQQFTFETAGLNWN